MSLMLKLLTTSILLTSSLVATTLDNTALAFEKKRFSKNSRIKIKSVTIYLKKETTVKGWYGYVFNIKADVGKEKNIVAKDIIFTNGIVATPDLIDMKTGKSLKNYLNPKLSSKYYNKEHLIVGNENAKNRFVIFSDPLCPFCIDYIPEVIKYVKKNHNNIALYYYHFPLLRIHPAADTITKAMDAAKKMGIKDVVLKVYEAQFDKYFTERERSPQKILDGFNKVLKTKLTLQQINDRHIRQKILKDIKMAEDALVQGTPTIFVNGEIDRTRLKYESIK